MTTISSISGGQQEPNLPKVKKKQIEQILFGEEKKPKKTQKPQGPTYDYQLGQREGNTRIIGPSGISSQAGISRLNDFFYHLSNSNNEADLSGEVGSSRQGRRGDCYLLAEINAIRNTDDGQKILDKNSRYDEATGDYIITLPGAVKVRQDYEKQGLGSKCEITGVYRITKAAMAKAEKLQGQSYSKGVLKVVAFEIAIENYRAELLQTQKNVGNRGGGMYTAQGSGTQNQHDILSGGYTYDAGFLLTGQKSDVYDNPRKYKNPPKYYQDGQYGYITREQMEQQVAGSRRSSFENSKAVSEVNFVTNEESNLSKMLDNYAGKEGDYAITASVIVGKDGPDGSTKRGGGHAVTVVKITDDIVYVSNPWHPDKIEPIPRKEFEKMTNKLVAQNMNEQQVNNTYLSNTITDMTNGSSKPPKKLSQNQLNQLTAILNSSGGLQNAPSPSRLNQFIQMLGGKIDPSKLNALLKRTCSGEEQQTITPIMEFLQNPKAQIDSSTIEKFKALMEQ